MLGLGGQGSSQSSKSQFRERKTEEKKEKKGKAEEKKGSELTVQDLSDIDEDYAEENVFSDVEDYPEIIEGGEYEEDIFSKRGEEGKPFISMAGPRVFLDDPTSFQKLTTGRPTLNGASLSTYAPNLYAYRLEKLNRTNIEIFADSVIVLSKLLEIPQRFFQELIDLATKYFPDSIRYKNPYLMILAYLSIDKEKLKIDYDYLNNILKQHDYRSGREMPIRDIDIIRYIRFLLPFIANGRKVNINDICKKKIEYIKKERKEKGEGDEE